MIKNNNLFTIDNFSEVYICCPSNLVTGGVELLHQLCDILNRNGRNAYIVYFGDGPKEVPEAYKNYNIKLNDEVVDKSNSIVVLCEVFFHLAFKFNKSQIFFWWLSVDNFYFSQEVNLSLKEYYLWDKKLVYNAFMRKLRGFGKFQNRFYNNYTFEDINNLNAVHGYQSEYAKDFLLKHHINKLVSLKDYINTEYYDRSDNIIKEDIIVYNPKKGLEFTKKLIDSNTSLKWVPIENMTRMEVLSLLKSAKLYVDFGYHPGKDRLPREACLNGCCVITGKLGAAGFFGDIPIPDKYKFDQNDSDISTIIITIKNILDNYSEKRIDFENYRKAILIEKEEFEQDALSIF